MAEKHVNKAMLMAMLKSGNKDLLKAGQDLLTGKKDVDYNLIDSNGIFNFGYSNEDNRTIQLNANLVDRMLDGEFNLDDVTRATSIAGRESVLLDEHNGTDKALVAKMIGEDALNRDIEKYGSEQQLKMLDDLADAGYNLDLSNKRNRDMLTALAFGEEGGADYSSGRALKIIGNKAIVENGDINGRAKYRADMIWNTLDKMGYKGNELLNAWKDLVKINKGGKAKVGDELNLGKYGKDADPNQVILDFHNSIFGNEVVKPKKNRRVIRDRLGLLQISEEIVIREGKNIENHIVDSLQSKPGLIESEDGKDVYEGVGKPADYPNGDDDDAQKLMLNAANVQNKYNGLLYWSPLRQSLGQGSKSYGFDHREASDCVSSYREPYKELGFYIHYGPVKVLNPIFDKVKTFDGSQNPEEFSEEFSNMAKNGEIRRGHGIIWHYKDNPYNHMTMYKGLATEQDETLGKKPTKWVRRGSRWVPVRESIKTTIGEPVMMHSSSSHNKNIDGYPVKDFYAWAKRSAQRRGANFRVEVVKINQDKLYYWNKKWTENKNTRSWSDGYFQKLKTKLDWRLNRSYNRSRIY